MTVGERIKQVRKSKSLTQKQLGILSKTSEITIRQYELGKRQPRLEQLKAIADALNTSVSALIGDISPFLKENALPTDGESMAQTEQRAKELGISVAEYLKSTPETTEAGKTYEKAIETAKVRIDSALDKLNPTGQEEAVKRVEELTEVPRYQKE